MCRDHFHFHTNLNHIFFRSIHMKNIWFVVFISSSSHLSQGYLEGGENTWEVLQKEVQMNIELFLPLRLVHKPRPQTMNYLLAMIYTIAPWLWSFPHRATNQPVRPRSDRSESFCWSAQHMPSPAHIACILRKKTNKKAANHQTCLGLGRAGQPEQAVLERLGWTFTWLCGHTSVLHN